jgi:hypothetical protein
VVADLDTLLTAPHVDLTDRIIPSRGFTRSGPGARPEVTDAELACTAVAQVLLRYDDERHWLRAASRLIGHLFSRLRRSEYNTRLRRLAPLKEAALRWLVVTDKGLSGRDTSTASHSIPLTAVPMISAMLPVTASLRRQLRLRQESGRRALGDQLRIIGFGGPRSRSLRRCRPAHPGPGAGPDQSRSRPRARCRRE